MSEVTPYITKLEQKLKRQTEAVIETQSLINGLKELIAIKLASSPNPIKTRP